MRLIGREQEMRENVRRERVGSKPSPITPCSASPLMKLLTPCR